MKKLFNSKMCQMSLECSVTVISDIKTCFAYSWLFKCAWYLCIDIDLSNKVLYICWTWMVDSLHNIYFKFMHISTHPCVYLSTYLWNVYIALYVWEGLPKKLISKESIHIFVQCIFIKISILLAENENRCWSRHRRYHIL